MLPQVLILYICSYLILVPTMHIRACLILVPTVYIRGCLILVPTVYIRACLILVPSLYIRECTYPSAFLVLSCVYISSVLTLYLITRHYPQFLPYTSLYVLIVLLLEGGAPWTETAICM